MRPPAPKFVKAPAALLLGRRELGALLPSTSREPSLVVVPRRLRLLLRLRLPKLPALKRDPKLEVGARSPFLVVDVVGVEGCSGWSPNGMLSGTAGGDVRLPGTLNKFFALGAEATRLIKRVATFGLLIVACGVM